MMSYAHHIDIMICSIIQSGILLEHVNDTHLMSIIDPEGQ